jgi:hypothetical protein
MINLLERFLFVSSLSGTWHVVVGGSFGSFFSHETKRYVHVNFVGLFVIQCFLSVFFFLP